MVALVSGGGRRTCANGHITVTVTSGGHTRNVCPVCLGEALTATAARPVTVNDFLARYEGGDHPTVSGSDSEAVSGLIRAASELYGAHDSAACRRVVSRVAKLLGLKVAEVMGWELKKFGTDGLSILRAESLAGTAE